MQIDAAEKRPPNPIALATVIQVQAPTSAKPGDKAWVSATGELEGWVGGGCVQPAIIKLSRQVLESGRPSLLRVAPDGQWEGVDGLTDFASSCLGRGAVLLFIEPMHSQPALCVMGESAVARSLADQAVNMSLNVILQAPGMDKSCVSTQVDVRSEYAQVKADYIVIATQGKNDKQAIMNALDCECSNISMVVSHRKLAALKDRLQTDGFKKSQLDRLKGPAGIHIGAQLPSEIALSILAQIIQLRRHVDAEPSQNEQGSSASLASQNSSTEKTENTGSGCCSD